MYYTIKQGDTLFKIARSFSLSIPLILSFNKIIANPDKIYKGQQLYIPNVQDVPAPDITGTSHDVKKILKRARSAINKGIRYKLGSGGMDPREKKPTITNKCDCSGFVCWVLGLSRKTDIPFYARFGGWIFTDSMVADINSHAGIFEKINTPEPGCIVVYGAGNRIGHVGIVSALKNGQMQKVIHCSSGNDRHYNDSIQETTPEVFNRAETLWGRFAG